MTKKTKDKMKLVRCSIPALKKRRLRLPFFRACSTEENRGARSFLSASIPSTLCLHPWYDWRAVFRSSDTAKIQTHVLRLRGKCSNYSPSTLKGVSQHLGLMYCFTSKTCCKRLTLIPTSNYTFK